MAQTWSLPGTYAKAMVHVRDGLDQWHYSVRIWHKTGLAGIWCVEDAEWCAFHAGCFSGATMGDLSLGHAHLASSVYSYIMTARHLNGHTIRIDLNQSASQIALVVDRRYSINLIASDIPQLLQPQPQLSNFNHPCVVGDIQYCPQVHGTGSTTHSPSWIVVPEDQYILQFIDHEWTPLRWGWYTHGMDPNSPSMGVLTQPGGRHGFAAQTWPTPTPALAWTPAPIRSPPLAPHRQPTSS